MIRLAKAIGANTDLLTAQAFFFSEDNQYLAILVSASGEDIFAKVRQGVLSLEELFFESAATVEERFDELQRNLQDTLKEAEELKLIIVLLKDNVLYLKSLGNHKAFILRDSQLIDLTDSAAQGQLISGYFKENDRLLLLTSKIDNNIAEGQNYSVEWDEKITQRLIKADLDQLEDELESVNQSLDKPDPVAVILAENISSEREEISPTPPQIPHLEIDKDEVFLTREEKPDTDFGLKYQADNSPYQSTDNKLLNRVIQSLARVKSVSRRVWLVLLVLIVLVLVAGSIYSFLNRTKSESQKKIAVLISDSKQKYQEAQSLKDSDPQKSKESLEEAQKKINQALALNPKNKEAQNLKSEIEKSSGSILNVNQINNWSTFLSLDLIKKDFSAKKMSYSLGKILLLDDKEKTLVSVDLQNKNSQILSGSAQLGSAEFASINGDNIFVYSSDKGLLKIDAQSKKVSVVAKSDSQWGKIADIFGFSGNIYLLDSKNNQIWKYVPIVSGYSSKNTYLKGQKNNLAEGKSLRIDYSVWVLKGENEITKFTAGQEDFFSFGGLDKPISKISAFFVPEDEDKVLLLDSANSRLVIVKKNGQYLSQYQSDKFASASDLVYEAKNHRLYLLESGKIQTTELK
ncbi:hypothetical protein HYS93_03425 [Candidatus Daviesbacteria bacterium]|nr:hypothetical protein [Candidatus Daviesbacteria bacterium]